MPTIRPANVADYELYASLFPDLRTPDEPPPRAKYEHDIAPASFVLVVDGEDAGIGYLEVLDGVGYVRQVVLARPFRGRGLGRVLMRECVRRLAKQGCTTWCLNVRPDNTAAIALYRSFGLQQAYASAAVKITWDRVLDLPDGEARVLLAPLLMASEIENAFGIPRGLVAKQIQHPARVVVVAIEAGRVVGMASFDPSFPGCFPFRASSAAIMWGLLDALRAYARPEDAGLQLVFEDSPELASTLERAGGERTLDFVHFTGVLPTAR